MLSGSTLFARVSTHSENVRELQNCSRSGNFTFRQGYGEKMKLTLLSDNFSLKDMFATFKIATCI